MKVSEAFPSQWLRAADLQGHTIRVTINVVQSEEVGTGEHKPVIYFHGKEKGLVMNKTNAATIAMAFGDDTDAWQGADIELFSMAVPFNGQMVPALRVRVPAAEPAKTVAAQPRQAPSRAPADQAFSEQNPPPITDNDIPF